MNYSTLKSPRRETRFKDINPCSEQKLFIPMDVKTFRRNHEIFQVLKGFAESNLLHKNTFAD